MAKFSLSRYESSQTNSRTRLDINLAHAIHGVSSTICDDMLSDGRIGWNY